MADNGLVSDRLVEFHRAIAAGGVAMTTLAYLAVSEEGRGAPNEIVVRPEAAPGLQHLADAVHAEGALVSAQIGHAGPVAAATGGRALTPSRLFSPVSMGFTRAATQFDIQRVIENFAASAAIVRDAGFDAVEVHLGHGYLLSSFLSPDTNRRKDEWGGSLAARAELPRRVLSAVREAVGPHCAVLAKLNMNDVVYHLVKNTPKVTGFLDANNKPQPISEAEAARILNTKEGLAAAPKKRVAVDYEIGDQVKVMSGPFASFNGVVEELDFDKNRVKVSVSIFGRATPVELDFEEVELMK